MSHDILGAVKSVSGFPRLKAPHLLPVEAIRAGCMLSYRAPSIENLCINMLWQMETQRVVSSPSVVDWCQKMKAARKQHVTDRWSTLCSSVAAGES